MFNVIRVIDILITRIMLNIINENEIRRFMLQRTRTEKIVE